MVSAAVDRIPKPAMASVVEHSPVWRAAVVVALGAVLQTILTPYLSFGFVSPKFAIVGIVFAVAALGLSQGLLLGFFGGILVDALGGGVFGVGTLAGLVAGALGARAGAGRRKRPERFVLAQVVALAVVAYDLVGIATELILRNVAGLEGPPVGSYLVWGVVPDALLNGILAYAIGGWLLGFVRVRKGG